MPADASLRLRITERLARFAVREHAGEGLKRAAVAIVISDRASEPTFLLTRRAAKLNAHGGQWALPGGRLDPGETAEAAALRECREEIDLNLDESAVLGRLDDYPTRSGYAITPIVLWCDGEAPITPNPAEVAAVYHIALTIFDRPGSPEFLTIPESDRPVIRLWLCEDDHIHAPTAAILWQFAEVALKGRDTRVDHVEQPVFAWR